MAASCTKDKQEPTQSWFAADESKRWCEKFLLVVTPLSIASLILGLIGSGWYKVRFLHALEIDHKVV